MLPLPRTKEFTKDLLVSCALMVMGTFIPGSVLDQGFQAHMGGIAIGLGLGWLVRAILGNAPKISSQHSSQKE